MKSQLIKVLILTGTLSLIAFLFIAVIENQYRKDESAVGLRLSYSCLAMGIVETLNGYYSDHGVYPDETQWTNEILALKNLGEFGCGPFGNDASFLEEVLTYKFVNKNEVSLYLKDSSGIEQSSFMLKFGKIKGLSTESPPP